MISTSGWFSASVHAAPLRDAVFLGPRLGGLDEEVRDHQDLDVREDGEVVQVLLADVARADDGDADGALAGWRLRSSCLCSFGALRGSGEVQEAERLGDALEDVPGVVVEFHDANFQ
jgi:hypothetical protein